MPSIPFTRSSARLLSVLLSVAWLGGCSSLPWFTGSTQVMPVTSPQPSSSNSSALNVISVVTSESCQRSRLEPPVTEAQTLAMLRTEASLFNADTIIDTACFSLPADENNYCYSRMVCSGKAARYR